MSAIDLALPESRLSAPSTPKGLWPTLAALAFGAFVIGTSEFLIMGILPDVANDLSISVGLAGQLVTAFALGIALGAPILTALTARLDRRVVVVGALAILAITNLAVAMLENYPALLAARFVGGMMAGLYYGVGIGSAAQLAPDHMKARAIATVFGGITLATVLGSPMGIYAGHLMGWQTPFYVLAALTAAAALTVRALMPATPSQIPASLKAMLSIFTIPAVVLVLVGTALVNTGWFAAYTYIAPYLTDVTGLQAALIPLVLVGYGVLSAIGNALGGKLADGSLKGTLFGSILVMVAALIGLRLFGSAALIVMPLLAIWALAAWSFVTSVQTRIVEAAGPSADLASALNISAFNTGIALGAAAGGLVVESAGTVEAMSLGAAAAAIALIPLLLSYRFGKR